MPSQPTLPYRFAGVSSPNTTQVPDQYLDELLPILSGADLKVLLYITRRTFGFKKASDNISISQMLNGITTRDGRVLDSGVGLTKKTLLQAINSLEAMNIVIREQRSSAVRGHEPSAYFLNIAGGYQPPRAEKDPLGEKLPQGVGVKTTPSPRGKNYSIQHTVEQHTDFEYSKEDLDAKESDLGDRDQAQHLVDKPDQTASSPTGSEAIGVTLARRLKQTDRVDNTAAITATIRQFATEFGDKAPIKSSVSRALRLFEESGLHRDVFIDALHLAKGEVKDRRQDPGNAPLPRNQMAYFFAVVEDRLASDRES